MKYLAVLSSHRTKCEPLSQFLLTNKILWRKRNPARFCICFLSLMFSVNNVCLLGNASAQFSAPSSLSSQITFVPTITFRRIDQAIPQSFVSYEHTHTHTHTSGHCSSVESLYQVLSYTWIAEMISLTVTVLGSGCTSTCLLTFTILISRIINEKFWCAKGVE